MGKRRDGRIAAVQYLYLLDMHPGGEPTSLEDFWKIQHVDINPSNASGREFANKLIHGVVRHRTEIDDLIGRCVENYEFARIAIVDRNILRLALYEMLHGENIPHAVAINEAIEISKKFGTTESKRFINGVLDRARVDLAKDAPAAGSKP